MKRHKIKALSFQKLLRIRMQIGKAKKEGKIHKDKDKCKEKDNLNGNAFSKM